MRRLRFNHLAHLAPVAFVAGISGAPSLAAQGVEGVLAGGEAITGAPCPEADVPIAGPDVSRPERIVTPLGPPVRVDTSGRGTADRTPGDSAKFSAASVGAAPRPPVAIALLASAEAREIRFAREPRIRVRLCGGLDSVHVVERRNLPRPVVAGQAYRDVYVAVEILGRVNAECLARRLSVRDSTGGPTGAGGACAALTVEPGAVAPPARPDSVPRSE